MFLLACTVWLLVQRDDDEWFLLWSSRNRFSLPHHHGLSLLQDGMEYNIHLNFLEEFLVLRHVPVGAGLRWMFSDAVLTQRFWLFHVRPGKWSFYLFAALTLLQHLTWISDAPISSISSMSATLMSPFQIPPAYNAYPRNTPGKTFVPNWCSGDWSFCRNRVIFDHCSKRNYWSVNWFSRSAFHMVSSHQTKDPAYFKDSRSMVSRKVRVLKQS